VRDFVFGSQLQKLRLEVDVRAIDARDVLLGQVAAIGHEVKNGGGLHVLQDGVGAPRVLQVDNKKSPLRHLVCGESPQGAVNVAAHGAQLSVEMLADEPASAEHEDGAAKIRTGCRI